MPRREAQFSVQEAILAKAAEFEQPPLAGNPPVPEKRVHTHVPVDLNYRILSKTPEIIIWSLISQFAVDLGF